MNEQSYAADPVETIIQAVAWIYRRNQIGPLLAAGFSEDQARAALNEGVMLDGVRAMFDEGAMLDGARAMLAKAKGVKTREIVQALFSIGVGWDAKPDRCSILLGAFQSGRLATVPNIGPVLSVKPNGYDVALITPRGVFDGVSARLKAPSSSSRPGIALPHDRRRTGVKKDAVKGALQALGAEDYKPSSLGALHEEVCSRLRWKRDAFGLSTLKRALEELGWDWRTLGA
jgi:hypothetical protein